MTRSNALELAGLAALAAAAWLTAPVLGLAVTGVALIIIGIGADYGSDQ